MPCRKGRNPLTMIRTRRLRSWCRGVVDAHPGVRGENARSLVPMGAGHGQEKARGGCGMPWRGTDPSERRAPRGQAPWPAPALVCQGPSRLRGQGRPQAVAQRPLMPEVWPRNLRGASPGCGVTPRAGWVPRACSKSTWPGSVWSVERPAPKRVKISSQAAPSNTVALQRHPPTTTVRQPTFMPEDHK